MMIRFQRVGRKNDPSFRLVVTEHTTGPKSGKHLELLGSYNPKTKATALSADRIKHWLSVGAQASGTVHNLLLANKIIEGKKVNVLPKKTAPKKEEPVVEAAPAASAPVAVEAAAPEVPSEEPAAAPVAEEATPAAA